MNAQPQPARSPGRYRRLLGYARPYTAQWLVVGAILLAGSAVGVAQPLPMQVLIDQVLGKEPMTGTLGAIARHLPGTETRVGLLAWVAVSSLGLYLLAAMIDSAVSYSWIRVGQRMVYDLTRDLFSITQRQSLGFHAKHPVGDSMTRIVTDSWCVYNVVESLLLTPGQAIFTTLGIVALMWRMDLRLTMVSLVVAPVISFGSLILSKRLRTVAKARREIESGIQAHVQQVLSGIHVVQAFGQETREHERFTLFAGQAVKAFRKGVLLTNLSNLFTGLVLTAGTGVVLLIGANRVIAGVLSIGELLTFLAYLTVLQSQIGTLARTYTALQSRRAEIDRVLEYLQAPNLIADRAGAIAIKQLHGDVQFINVTFGYEPHRPVLQGLTLHIPAGKTVALVGPTGAGKSTLVSLLPRFFDPGEGTVKIDGRDVRDFKVRDLRQQIALVLQESFLFPITIAQNIAFGRPDATLEEIQRAAETANAAEFILNLPDGYHTIIGERGTTLSGGQKQRLSIARALLKDAPLLILDEPTAALDTVTEHAILEAMRRLMKGRTTLIIAHRLSTIRDADLIAVLDAGRIAELGTHVELMQQSGMYARFCNVQGGLAAAGAST